MLLLRAPGTSIFFAAQILPPGSTHPAAKKRSGRKYAFGRAGDFAESFSSMQMGQHIRSLHCGCGLDQSQLLQKPGRVRKESKAGLDRGSNPDEGQQPHSREGHRLRTYRKRIARSCCGRIPSRAMPAGQLLNLRRYCKCRWYALDCGCKHTSSPVRDKVLISSRQLDSQQSIWADDELRLIFAFKPALS